MKTFTTMGQAASAVIKAHDFGSQIGQEPEKRLFDYSGWLAAVGPES